MDSLPPLGRLPDLPELPDLPKLPDLPELPGISEFEGSGSGDGTMDPHPAASAHCPSSTDEMACMADDEAAVMGIVDRKFWHPSIYVPTLPSDENSEAYAEAVCVVAARIVLKSMGKRTMATEMY